MNCTIRLLSLATLVTLAACGGGSDDAATQPTISGKFSGLSVTILSDGTDGVPPHSLWVNVFGSFDGTVTPAADTFTIPFVMTRDGPATYQTGTMTFTLKTGSDGVRRYLGSGTLSLPAQPVGEHIYTTRMDPASAEGYAFVGTVYGDLPFPVTVRP